VEKNVVVRAAQKKGGRFFALAKFFAACLLALLVSVGPNHWQNVP
jgi:hypothetical protein